MTTIKFIKIIVMAAASFTRSYLVDQDPATVFNAINDVSAWWSQDFSGASRQVGDEFEVHFADVHYSKHKITALVPGSKISWLVTDSRLSFLEKRNEWNDTANLFEISKSGDQTMIVFTHIGLEPGIECFKDCSKGWDYFLGESLLPYINTGRGKPNEKTEECTNRRDKV